MNYPINVNSEKKSLECIAFVTGGMKLGGSTTFLLNICREFMHIGVRCIVISFEAENPMAEDFRNLGISVHCEDDRQMIFEDRLSSVLEQLRRFSPQAVVSTLGAISFEILRYCEGVTRIGMIQSDDPGVYDMVSNYVPHMDFLAVVSRHIEENVINDPRFQGIKVHYLPYGVPMPSSEKSFRDPAAPLEIVYLGRLDHEQKRAYLFPEIATQLVNSGISFHWTICGDGPHAPWLKEQLSDEVISGAIRILPPISYADVPDFLRNFDIFLLTSDYEGLPLSLLEAMGQGLVPVVSDLPSGIREVVNDRTGVLIPIDALSSYAKAIIELAGNRFELMAKSTAARLHVVDTFSTRSMSLRWLDALAQFPSSNLKLLKSISAPLRAKNTFLFLPLFRVIRRSLKRLDRFFELVSNCKR